MKSDLRRSLSARRVVLILLSIVTCALVARGLIYYWYLGGPNSLFYQNTERRLCMRCGAQSLGRQYSVLELDFATTPKQVTRSTTGYENHDCNKTSIIISESTIHLPVGAWKPIRWSYGKLDDPFWSNPALIRAIAEIHASIPADALKVLVNLVNWHVNGRMPPPVTTALNGTNSVAIRQALYDASPGDKLLGRFPAIPHVSTNRVNTPKPSM